MDNIEYDTSTDQILMGVSGTLESLLKRLKDDNHASPGGLAVLKKKQGCAHCENKGWYTEALLMHDGTKLSQISAGARFGDIVILGSPFSKGVLVCSVKIDGKQ